MGQKVKRVNPMEVLLEFSDLLAKHGTWFTISISLIVIIVSFVRWAAPRADQIIDSHFQTLRAFRRDSRIKRQVLLQLNNKVKQVDDKVDKLHGLHTETLTIVKKIHKGKQKDEDIDSL